MDKVKYGEPGKMPIYQDDLARMQQAVIDTWAGFLSIPADQGYTTMLFSPVVAQVTQTSPTFWTASWDIGYIAINNEMMRISAGSFSHQATAGTGTPVGWYWKVVETVYNTRQYADGNPHDTWIDQRAELRPFFIPGSQYDFLAVPTFTQLMQVKATALENLLNAAWIPASPVTISGATATAPNRRMHYKKVGASLHLNITLVQPTVTGSIIIIQLPQGIIADVNGEVFGSASFSKTPVVNYFNFAAPVLVYTHSINIQLPAGMATYNFTADYIALNITIPVLP